MPVFVSSKWYLYLFSGISLFIWIAGEAHFYFGEPEPGDRDQLIEQALSGAAQTFEAEEQAFINETRQLVSSIEPIIRDGGSAIRVHNRLLNETGFRGVSVFKERSPFTWIGNSVPYLPAPDQGPVYVDVHRSGYIIYFVGQITFYDDDGIRYDVVSSRLIRRSGASPQLLTQQYDVTREWAGEQLYPVNFHFLDAGIAPLGGRQRSLSTTSVDSVGLVTASTADMPALRRSWQQDKMLFRQILLISFLLSCFTVLVLFFHRKGTRTGGLCLMLISAGTWGLLHISRLASGTMEQTGLSSDAGLQIILFMNAVFISVIAVGAWHWISAPRTDKEHLSAASDGEKKRSALLSRFTGPGELNILMGGLLMGGGGAWILCNLFLVTEKTEANVLALKIFPEFQSWFVYISSFLLFSAYFALLFINARLLLSHQKNRILAGIFLLLSTTAGILLFLAFDEFDIPPKTWGSFLALSLIFFILFMIPGFSWARIKTLSRPRLVAIMVFASMLISLPVFVGAEREKEDATMFRMAVNYAASDSQKAREISIELMDRLLREGVLSEVQEVEAAPSLPLQTRARFRQQVDRQIDENWRPYTILSFLLDGRLNIIADYGSPSSFSERFSSSFHDEVRRFIRDSLQRPFARLPIIESDERFRGFPVFIKGLQSIPSDYPTQPSWLVTFVLVEGKSFGRPIHDALAFHERDQENRNRYVATRYQNRVKVASDAAPSAPVLQQLYRLPESVIPATGDSVNVYSRSVEEMHVRELVYRFDEQTHVAVTVRDYSWLHYIFSGFRYFVALLVLCLLIYQLFKIFSYRSRVSQPQKKQKPQRLQDKILDSYLIATLLFLVALTFVTEYIVARQNVRITEQELFRNLSAVEKRLDDRLRLQYPDGGRQPLPGLQDVDMMVYEDSQLLTTTTPELFRLQLMSHYLPFRAHQRIHEEHHTTVFEPVNIGTLPVIMGFRALLDDGQARRILAMPAYTRSASYEQEFLQTTTYLIAFYIIIFLFFTGLAWIVARNLTQPLAAFKTGLRQISTGELNTKIPVSSNDEIGELARAYNQMLDDLVALRGELAKVERETAWSEMARQVAHEIKNPLTPMKLSIQHLQRQMHTGARSMEELKPSIERLTEMLVKQIDSLNKIASDFSAFAKPMNGTQIRVELETMLSDILRLFEHHDHISISTSFENTPVFVMGIEDELRRVFINLITNAIEAMPEGGSLSLLLELQQEQQQVNVSVIDTGNGIDGDIQDRIFTPNFSTKTSGTGLGLAISKKIIEAHGGSILFSSSGGNGTRFDVVLPHRPSV